jgi:hypothetical protein
MNRVAHAATKPLQHTTFGMHLPALLLLFLPLGMLLLLLPCCGQLQGFQLHICSI